MEESSDAEIYLLTGAFGAGKTTFIRKLLANPQSMRFAVIQNEFAAGEMGIEQPLIVDETGMPFSSFLELPNGCICCSAKNDLVAAIQYIVANTPVRKILVETNGMADPVQSIKQFWFDEEALIKAQLHSVIGVVSAKRWRQDSGALFERQVAASNKVVVSFVDQIDEQQYQEVVGAIRGINFECQIQRNDVVDPAEFLGGASIFSKETLKGLSAEKVSHHGHQLRPVFIKGKCTFKNQLELEQALGMLLWESGMSILRIKGVICLEGLTTVLELQGVEDLFQVKPTKTSTAIYNNQTRILVIGQKLDEQQLLSSLKIVSL